MGPHFLIALVASGVAAGIDCGWSDGDLRPPAVCAANCRAFVELHQSNRGRWNWNYYANVSSLISSSPLWSSGLVVEIGTAWGGLALHLLGALPDVRVASIDPFLGGYDNADTMSRYITGLQSKHKLSAAQVSRERGHAMTHEIRHKHGCRYRLFNALSTEVAPLVANSTVSVLFIDGDHTLAGVLADIRAWLPKVRPGGLVVFNDFGGPFRHKFGVRSAVWRLFGGGPGALGPGATWPVKQEGSGETNCYIVVPESGNPFIEPV